MREILPNYEEDGEGQNEANGMVDPNCFEVRGSFFP